MGCLIFVALSIDSKVAIFIRPLRPWSESLHPFATSQIMHKCDKCHVTDCGWLILNGSEHLMKMFQACLEHETKARLERELTNCFYSVKLINNHRQQARKCLIITSTCQLNLVLGYCILLILFGGWSSRALMWFCHKLSKMKRLSSEFVSTTD